MRSFRSDATWLMPYGRSRRTAGSRWVATRRREIGVRMALGSTRRRVFGLILSDIVKLVIPGIAGGLLLAAVLIRTVEKGHGHSAHRRPNSAWRHGAADLHRRIRDRGLGRGS